MNPVDPKFVNSLMENIYGNKEEIKHQTSKEAEDSVEAHATTMENFGIPKNVGNAWKAPKAPEPRKQKLEDHKDEDKSLTESIDPMEERISNLEEGLVNILESLKSFVAHINEEGPSDKDLDDIEDEEPKNAQDTAVGAQGEAAKSGDKVPVGKRGEGKTADLDHVLKGVTKGSAKEKELKMKARGHKLTKKQLAKNKGKMPKQLNKKEIKEISKDS